MFRKFWRLLSGPPESKAVQVNVINAIELKPEANYVLIVDPVTLPRKQVEQVLRDLRRAGVRNVVSFMLQGSPDEAIQVISKEKKNATATSRRKH